MKNDRKKSITFHLTAAVFEVHSRRSCLTFLNDDFGILKTVEKNLEDPHLNLRKFFCGLLSRPQRPSASRSLLSGFIGKCVFCKCSVVFCSFVLYLYNKKFCILDSIRNSIMPVTYQGVPCRMLKQVQHFHVKVLGKNCNIL